MIAVMDDGYQIPITKEQVADLAGEYFLNADIEDTPSKLWLDYYVPGKQLFLRACFDHGIKTISLVRLGALAMGLDERHGTEIIPVAYGRDYEWDEIEGFTRALNRVL